MLQPPTLNKLFKIRGKEKIISKIFSSIKIFANAKIKINFLTLKILIATCTNHANKQKSLPPAGITSACGKGCSG